MATPANQVAERPQNTILVQEEINIAMIVRILINSGNDLVYNRYLEMLLSQNKVNKEFINGTGD